MGSGPENLGNGRRDSEDVDGNGTLDPEDASSTPYLVVPLDPGTSPAATGWSAISHTFTAAELARLRRARCASPAAGGIPERAAASGRFEVERHQPGGQPVPRRERASTSGARRSRSGLRANPPPAELEDAFPEVAEIFHPYGETQKVLEVDWSGGADWQVRGLHPAATEGIDYRRIVYYYRLPADPGGADLSFSLLDDAGKGHPLDHARGQCTYRRLVEDRGFAG